MIDSARVLSMHIAQYRRLYGHIEGTERLRLSADSSLTSRPHPSSGQGLKYCVDQALQIFGVVIDDAGELSGMVRVVVVKPLLDEIVVTGEDDGLGLPVAALNRVAMCHQMLQHLVHGVAHVCAALNAPVSITQKQGYAAPVLGQTWYVC